MEPSIQAVSTILDSLRGGLGIKVKDVGGESVLRIEWLNLYNEPDVLGSLGALFAHWITRLGYSPDAVVSIETSGAKYGVATSLSLGVPYVSLHKGNKLIFDDPVSVESRSITEGRPLKLFGDKSIIGRFSSVVLVDDIRRTSQTIDSAVDIIEKCGSSVESCFVVLDFKFAGHPYPRRIRSDAFHSLFEVASVSAKGACDVQGGLALKYLEERTVKADSH
jgi:adenine/guanine phosphoribosyltransferase-like PRPP-binding protein